MFKFLYCTRTLIFALRTLNRNKKFIKKLVNESVTILLLNIFCFSALSTLECSRPMRCFPKFHSWDYFVRLHDEVIIFY